jgi:nicotinamide phosphoribosyltransferase
MKIFPLHAADFYKVGHPMMIPEDTVVIYSTFTPRGTRIPWADEIMFFGLQYFLQEFLIRNWNNEFFFKPKAKVIRKYQRRMDSSLGPGSVPVEHIEALHDLGYLPLVIKAVPEGTLVPMRTPMLTIRNTKHGDKSFAWLTNYMESLLSCILWKPCTSATTAFHYRKEFERHMRLTGGPMDFVKWQGHDFSFRGMSGPEDAALSGAAHLLSFTGTDTILAIDFLEDYYGADSNTELIGGSIPATEHMIHMVASEGLTRDECVDSDYFTLKRLITKIYPNGPISIVSDTWNFWKMLKVIIPGLKAEILERDGRLVIRPDSGDPVHIVAGYRFNEVQVDYVNDEPRYFFVTDDKTATEMEDVEFVGAYEYLYKLFPGTITSLGYKQLDTHIGLIYGDSITMERQRDILKRLEEKGFCASNLVLGIGSFTYQYVTRDTYMMAMKATYAETRDGRQKEIFKDPITDNGIKKSARGLVRVNEDLTYTDGVTWEEESKGILQTVFQDGVIVKRTSLAEIRAVVENHLTKEKYQK